jgi:hypothetical protein
MVPIRTPTLTRKCRYPSPRPTLLSDQQTPFTEAMLISKTKMTPGTVSRRYMSFDIETDLPTRMVVLSLRITRSKFDAEWSHRLSMQATDDPRCWELKIVKGKRTDFVTQTKALSSDIWSGYSSPQAAVEASVEHGEAGNRQDQSSTEMRFQFSSDNSTSRLP